MTGMPLARLLVVGQLAVDPSSFTLSGNSSETLLQNGRYFEYVRVVERELIGSPSNARLHASLALGYYLLGQRRFCKEEIQEALSLLGESRKGDSPGTEHNDAAGQVHYVAGRIYMGDKAYKDAAAQLQAALLLDPQNSKIEYFLGVCLQALDQSEGARTHFEHACQAGAYSWPCRALAEMELDDRNGVAARSSAEQAVRIEPTSAEAQFVAGKAAESARDTSAAVSFFRRAAELDPSWEAPHYSLARLYGNMPEKNAEAAKELAQFQELSSENQ
jgi:tetratricopeptide (TPR) repeat protein